MSHFRNNVAFYNQRFHVQSAYWPQENVAPDLKVSVVIPAYNEDLVAVLESLAHCKVDTPDRIEVLIVLNHSPAVEDAVKQRHSLQLQKYNDTQLANGVAIHCIAAFDLPPKKAGVGLARKIGMDTALHRFATVNHDGLIVCLDGDCTVSTNYLSELLKVENLINNGLSIAFEHDVKNTTNQYFKEIIDYEIFLRYYVHALRYAGYRHAYHTVGSSMAVRASAYAKIGGMNTRKAGEDFYFLHKLIPQGKFYDLTTATVFPSSRQSTRVPFGTGRAMLEMQQGSKSFDTLYHPQIFKDLKQVMTLKPDCFPASYRAFLSTFSLHQQLTDLMERSKDEPQFRKNFHHWMDGFKVLKYVHYCRDHIYENVPVTQAVNELLGINEPMPKSILHQLRTMDRDSAFSIFKT